MTVVQRFTEQQKTDQKEEAKTDWDTPTDRTGWS